ncbi:MAG: HAD-IC family P-type ATPase, partial [Kineosporiaceae bacterium]
MTRDPLSAGASEQERAGLTADQARARLAADGSNALPPPARTPAWRRLARQFTDVFALLLWGAAALAWVAGLIQLTVAISLVVLVNAAFAFGQERRADHAAERLRSLLPTRVTVRRDRLPRQIDASEVVTGDVLVLEAGDRVPADARILLAGALLVDTSTLTGESEPTSMAVGDAAFAGTFVVEGTAEALVTATGAGTRLAGIARATTQTEPHPTPLTRELHRVVRGIGGIAVATGVGFFALTLAIGRPATEGFLLAIGVTVALVPEALLPTVTLALAWGAEQMAHRNVLVRSLDAVETLGSTTFVCTDKTGTLTRNEMTVVEAWTPTAAARVSTPGYDPRAEVEIRPPRGATEDADTDGRAGLERLARAGARCSRGYVEQDPAEAGGRWHAHGDPMEAAIDAFARRLGLDTAGPRAHGHTDVAFAFDPHRRRMSVVADGEVIAKGAPDVILPL